MKHFPHEIGSLTSDVQLIMHNRTELHYKW